MLERALGATTILGTDLSANRLEAANDIGLVDAAIKADDGSSGQTMSRAAARSVSGITTATG
jgi:hypothetical protein